MRKIHLLFSFLFLLTAIMIAKEDESWKVFDDSQIAIIEITVDPADLQYMYNYPHSDSVHACTVHFKNAYIDQVLENVGIRIRGNTSRVSEKKSFKISIDEYTKGNDLLGIEKLNLNGEHNDPSIMRAKLAWDIALQMGMTATRAAHAAVYINNKYYGLYISVEHIDEEFIQKNFADDSGNLWKCLYPAPLKFRSDEKYNTQAYELTTNKKSNDYSQLARLIKIINNTPQGSLHDSIESVLNIKSVLQYLALNILIGSWDDYRFNQSNYYLYNYPEENIFYWLPYDYDNTFGISWSETDWSNQNPYTVDINRPLVYKLLSDPQYRNLYTHFLEFYNNNVFRLDFLKERIDRFRFNLSGYASNDTFRTKDYGYTLDDFLNSYSETSYNKAHVKNGIKEFIIKRNASLPAQLSYLNPAKPIIYEINWHPENPGPDDSIHVSVSAFSNSGLKTLTLNLKINESLHSIPLTYSPVKNSKRVEEADRWTGIIPPLQKARTASFTVTAEDVNSVTQQYPRTKEVGLRAELQAGPVVLNELLASNSTINTDENNQYEDWVELYNNSDQAVDISGKYITDNPANLDKWELPSGTILQPRAHLLIWCDEDSSQGLYHANFRLSADGEFLALVDNDGSTILDSLTFPAQTTDISYGRFPDGSDNWQMLFPTPSANNSLTSVNDEEIIPEEFIIYAYPNPFNPAVNISYSLPEVSDVSIKIYDMLGKELYSFSENNKSAGSYSFNWDASGFSTGSYVCVIKTNKASKTLKLMLLK